MEGQERRTWVAFTLHHVIGLRETSFHFRLVLCLPFILKFQLEMMLILSLVSD